MTWVRELLDHPAVMRHGEGVDSADLASFHEVLMDVGRSRFVGIGDDQYAHKSDRQHFETYAIEQIVSELVDEIADAQNYLTMATIKALARLRSHVE